MSQRWQAVAADSVQFLDHSTESPVTARPPKDQPGPLKSTAFRQFPQFMLLTPLSLTNLIPDAEDMHQSRSQLYRTLILGPVREQPPKRQRFPATHIRQVGDRDRAGVGECTGGAKRRRHQYHTPKRSFSE